MPIPLLVTAGLTGLSALAGLAGNRSQKQESSGTATSRNQSQSSSRSSTESERSTQRTGRTAETGGGTSTTSSVGVTQGTNFQNTGTVGTTSALPQFSQEAKPLIDQLTQRYLELINNPINENGILATGIRGINESADANTNALQGALAARGLNNSPIAVAAQQDAENRRFGDIVSFKNQLPTILQNIQAANLGQANNFLQNFRGTAGTQTGQTAQTGGATQTSQQEQSNISSMFRNAQTWEDVVEVLRQQVQAEENAASSGTTNQTGTVTQPGNMTGGALTGASSLLSLLAGLGKFDKP